ncbi:MAG: S1 family peptidase [Acidimicrobiales bacterium]
MAVSEIDPDARLLVVSTTGCGDAGAATASGVWLGDGDALTAAHVVAGSAEVSVASGGGPALPAVVVAYDTRRDLARLNFEPSAGAVATSWPTLVDLDVDDRGEIVGVTSGRVPFAVAEETIIDIDEVRTVGRARRHGYRLEATTSPGDSGAGLWSEDGELGGLLFAVSTDDDTRSWAVTAGEIDAFLADDSLRGTWLCDPDRSKLVPTDP